MKNAPGVKDKDHETPSSAQEVKKINVEDKARFYKCVDVMCEHFGALCALYAGYVIFVRGYCKLEVLKRRVIF